MAKIALLVTAPDFECRLQDGEQMLWQGKPDPALFNRPRLFVYSLILLPFMPIIVWALAAKFGTGLPLVSPLTGLISLAIWPIACYCMAAYVGEQTPWAAYALTSRRVMIRRLQRLTSQDSRPKIEEYPLSALKPRLQQGKDGTGTITLGFPAWHYELAFRAIPDAADMFARLTEARTALAPGRTDMPYYLKQAPVSLPAQTVESYLQRGETVLWSGGIDPAAWWRTQRAAIIVLHLLIPAAIGTFLAATNQWTPLGQALAFLPALALYPVWRIGTMRKVYTTQYVLTSRRVLVLKGRGSGPRSVEERALAETAAMRLEKLKNGTGTIVFERHSHWVWHGQSGHKETYEYSFQHIADVQAVFGQIAAARAAGEVPPPSAARLQVFPNQPAK